MVPPENILKAWINWGCKRDHSQRVARQMLRNRFPKHSRSSDAQAGNYLCRRGNSDEETNSRYPLKRKLQIRIVAGFAEVIQGEALLFAEARFELTTGARREAPLLTRQARSSSCGLGRAFGHEPKGSVRPLTARGWQCQLIQPLKTFPLIQNRKVLLRFYDAACLLCTHCRNALSPQ